MMQRIRWFLLLLGIIVLLVLSLANKDPVPVKVPLVFETEMPLSMLLIATSAMSFVLGALMTGWMLRNRGKGESKKTVSESNVAGRASDTAEPNPLLKS